MQCFTGFVFAFFFARFFCCKIVCIFFESTCFLSDIAALFLASFGLLLVECSQIIILGFILCKSLNLYSIFLFYFYWRQLFPHNTNSCVGLPPPKKTNPLEVSPCTHPSLLPSSRPFPLPYSVPLWLWCLRFHCGARSFPSPPSGSSRSAPCATLGCIHIRKY